MRRVTTPVCGHGRAQVWTWRDSLALFEHAREVTGPNHVIHVNLAEAYADAGSTDLALQHYEESLRLFPEARLVHTRMGVLLASRGQIESALEHFRESVRRHPAESGARVELARLVLRAERVDRAATLLEKELEVDPGSPRALLHLGEIAVLRGDRD